MSRLVLAFAAMALLLAGVTPASAAADLAIVQRISGPDGGWDYASFDAARGRVYISHGTVVLSLDVKTGKLDANFAQGDRLHSIVAVPGTDVLVTTNSGDSTVKIISAVDGTRRRSSGGPSIASPRVSARARARRERSSGPARRSSVSPRCRYAARVPR